MNLRKKRKIEREMDYTLGAIISASWFMIAGVIVGAYIGSANMILAGMALYCIMLLLTPHALGGYMIKAFQRLVGITEANGKLEALATHLKIRFQLIPEHWKVMKLGKKA